MIKDKGINIPVSLADAQHNPGEPGNTMCLLPFMHLHTWPGGHVFPCCVYDSRTPIGNMNEASLEEIWNNDEMRTLRKQLVEGEVPPNCHRCFQREDEGISSFRLYRNQVYFNKDTINAVHSAIENDYRIEDFHLYYWDFRNSNLCNMTCRTCGPELSSKWHEDYKAIMEEYKYPDKHGLVEAHGESLNEIHDIINRDVDKVMHVYFAGGEPLINDMHYYILNKLIEHERFDVTISYNTNLLHLQYKNYDLMELWDKFNKVEVWASIDAIGPKAEYIRRGTNWPKVEANLKTLVANKHINLRVTPVISIFNVLHIPEYINYMVDIGMNITQIGFHNILLDPLPYHMSMLPGSIKMQVRELYTQFIIDKQNEGYSEIAVEFLADRLSSIQNYLDVDIGDRLSRKKHAQNFLYLTKTLDHVRNETFLDIFPELKDYWDTCMELPLPQWRVKKYMDYNRAKNV
jgi:radical SAM protein with 4Fe4S-binding SPASM domain|tara:strand:+ start:724 stop:2103 length:1380 start_codon:yes stop_codon:yes gene_type:complete